MTKSSAIKKTATIRDVARLAGVSVATISRYLNNNALLAEETASRVKEAMHVLHYTPDQTARSLATRRTYTIGFLAPSIKGIYMTPLLEGIENAAREEGYNLMLATYMEDSSGQKQLPIDRHNVEGLIIFSGTLNHTELLALSQREMPFVMILQTPPEDVKAPGIVVDNKNASRHVVEHLVRVHGCRRIMHMYGPEDQEDSYWRKLGYLEALQAEGIALDESRLIAGMFDRNLACQALRQYIARGEPFDAIFAADDETAVGAYSALQEAGFKIPGDVKLVGFDNQFFAPYLNPPLSTVNVPLFDMGRLAVRKLFNLMRGGQSSPLELLPTQLVLRQSCGCQRPQMD